MNTVQRKLLSLGGSLLALCAVAAYAYFGTYQGKKKEDEDKQKEEKMASFKLVDVKEVRLMAKGTTFEMIGDGEGERKWRMVKPVETTAEKSTVETLINHFADMKRKRVLEPKPEELKNFGIEPPVATVAFKMLDGTETLYLVGKKNSFDDAVYLMKEGDTKLAMVPGGLTYQTDRDLFSMREKRLAIFDDKEVQKIAVDVAGKPSFALDKKGDDWQLTLPTEAKADKPAVTSMLSNLRNIRAKAFAAEKWPSDAKELAGYGLDKPAAEVTLILGASGAKTKLLLGVVKTGTAPATSERYFAHVDGPGPVLELADNPVKKVDLKPADLRDKTVLAFERDQVKKIKLAETGKDFILLEKKDTTWEVTAPEQKPGNDGKVSNLLFKLSSMKAKSIIADKATPELKKKHGLDPVSKQVTLFKADGSEAGTLIIGLTAGDETAVFSVSGGRIDGVDKTQLVDLSFDVKDYAKEEPKVAATPQSTAPSGQ